MKKSLLVLAVIALAGSQALAQTVIFDNGPIFDLAGGGAAGANASTLHDGLGTYGLGHAVSSGFRVADDIIVPPGESWSVDSLVFYAYQTGSGNTSTITEVNLNIWDGDPGTGTVVFGDGVTNLMITSEWTGAYRTNDIGAASCPAATCVDRPIMRNALVIGTVLGPGTYWFDWQTGGSIASGPWAPPINLGAGITTTGNSKQYDPTGAVWNDVTDGSLTTETVGLPFLVVGTILTGVNEIYDNSNVSVYPNPVKESTTVTINGSVQGTISFIMYDILGNQVKNMTGISERKFNVNMSDLSKGIYLYEVMNGADYLKKGKIVVQ